MPFTEFCCRSGGSNLNAGTVSGSSAEPATAAVYSHTNADWNASTGVYTPASGDPSASVNVGDFASIYLDAATSTPFVGRVTAVDSTTITVSLTAKSGTAPTTGATGRSIRVGGAWQGPNGSSGFPMTLVQSTMTNASSHMPRINFKNDQTYSITATITHSNSGPAMFQGYASSYGDGARATLDGAGASPNSILLWNQTGNRIMTADWILQNNGGATSTQHAGLSVGGTGGQVYRVVARNIRASGFICGQSSVIHECEAYSCNLSDTANRGGFETNASGTSTFVRCFSHDNNRHGFIFGFSTVGAEAVYNCVAESNSEDGFSIAGQISGSISLFIGCDSWNNGRDGMRIAGSNAHFILIESSNFVKSGGWGINRTASGVNAGLVLNCGFGSWTQGNALGNINNLPDFEQVGVFSYGADVTPWIDPANGDFRIVLDAAKHAGRGGFTQTQTSYGGTIGYPDVGAARHTP